MPQTFYEVIWIFIIYAFIGWCSEVSYAALDRGIFVNRGFLNGPYCPIYGCGVLIVVVLLTPLKKNLLILYLGSFLLTSVLEFITGFVMEKVFHNKWWDYSNKPFNIMGYVCLKFSIFWGLACTFIMLIIHPIIYGFIRLIPHIVGVVLLVIIMTGFVIDVVVTVSTIVKFNRRLKVMDDIAAKIKVLSNQIGENIYENVEEALEKSAEFKEEHAEQIEEFEEKKEKLATAAGTTKEKITGAADSTRKKITGAADETKEKLENLRHKYDELLSKRNAVSSRLMKAFPDMKSKYHNEILQKLKKINIRK